MVIQEAHILVILVVNTLVTVEDNIMIIMEAGINKILEDSMQTTTEVSMLKTMVDSTHKTLVDSILEIVLKLDNQLLRTSLQVCQDYLTITLLMLFDIKLFLIVWFNCLIRTTLYFVHLFSIFSPILFLSD